MQPAIHVNCSRCRDTGVVLSRPPSADNAWQGNQLIVPCPDCQQYHQRRMQQLAERSGMTPHIRKRWTFATYDYQTVPLVEAGYRAVRRFADDIKHAWKRKRSPSDFELGDYWCVTLYGPFGGGKSHLGYALLNELHAHGVPALRMFALDLWPYLGCVAEPDPAVDYEARLREVAEVPVLVLDEPGGRVNDNFQVEPLTPAAFSRRTRIIEHRWEHRLPTLLLDQRDPDDWGDPATADRIHTYGNPCIQHGPIESYRRHVPGQPWTDAHDG